MNATDLQACAEFRKNVMSKLDYEPETGVFKWKVTPSQGVKAGDIAGGCHGGRHKKISIAIGGKKYAAHKLAWLIAYSEWPSIIDHKNRDGIDNRLINLRAADKFENARNAKLRVDNKYGCKGVTYRSDENRWYANIRANGKQIYLGSFLTMEGAAKAYSEAADKLHGEFASPTPLEAVVKAVGALRG
jgi:hypothetical protein